MTPKEFQEWLEKRIELNEKIKEVSCVITEDRAILKKAREM